MLWKVAHEHTERLCVVRVCACVMFHTLLIHLPHGRRNHSGLQESDLNPRDIFFGIWSQRIWSSLNILKGLVSRLLAPFTQNSVVAQVPYIKEQEFLHLTHSYLPYALNCVQIIYNI